MPSARRTHNAHLARKDALHTYVYISGLCGQHTLETGLAYYYRGHYIYAYPAANLIEPIPYSTRKGIMIQGIVSASAPVYDAGMEGLVEESSVRALEASVEGEKEAKERVEDDRAKEIAEVVAGEVLKFCSPSRPSSSGAGVRTEDLQPSLASLAAPRNASLSTFTPHHGAHFLAASAPGSRLGSRAASPSDLRSISSHAGLARLGAIKGQIKCLGGRASEADTVAEDASPSISHPSSSVGYLFGLGDHALTAEDLPPPIELSGGVRMAPCAIHGEKCDGITTTEPWLTERTMRGNGFLEEVPMLESGGRVMVDWAELLDEEKVVASR